MPPAARLVRPRGRAAARLRCRGGDALPDAAHLRRRGRPLFPEQAAHRRLRAYRGASRLAHLRGPAARDAPRRSHHRRPVRSGDAGLAVPHPARARVAHRRGLHRLPFLAPVAARRGPPARGRDHFAAAVQARLAHLRDGRPHGAHRGGSRRDAPPPAASPHSRRVRGAARMTEGLLGLAAFLLLAFFRVPMAFAMGIVGFFGFAWKVNFGAAASMIAQTTYETGLAYTLSVIPLFILMGNFVVRARMSDELYHAAYTFLVHRRGRLAISTIVASAGFGSICGSSIATAATFANVAYPSMRRFGYKDTLASGSIAAGGTLGILIPPSVIMVIYGIMTETNIGKLFAAGIFPGIVATLLLCLAVAWMTRRDPQAGPPGERSSWAVRLDAIRRVWPVG